MMAIIFELTATTTRSCSSSRSSTENAGAGALLLAATAMTGFLDWAPTRYLPNTKPWDRMRMPSGSTTVQ